MKTDIYTDIKNKVLELNRINDEVSLFEWTNDDGPKFDSVEEMKEFEEFKRIKERKLNKKTKKKATDK